MAPRHPSPADSSSRLVFFYLLGLALTTAVCLFGNPLLVAGGRGWWYPGLLLSTYPAMYLLPAIALSLAVRSLAGRRPRAIAGASIAALSATLMLLQADLSLYALYGFHINGFVWNLVSTPGGLASLGMGPAARQSLLLVVALLLITVAGLWYLAGLLARRRSPRVVWVLVPLLLLTLVERGYYAFNHFLANGQVLELAASMPLYQPATAAHWMERLGYVRAQRDIVTFSTLDDTRFQYPLVPLTAHRRSQPPNIIVLVAESLRADMLTPEIMPKLWAFSRHAQRFTRHYSGGNGTRQGLFSLFYGLYGNSWDHFLYRRQPPALFAVLAQHSYQRLAITSASFSYPEFDKTLFADFTAEELVADGEGPAWQRDVRNVDRLLGSLARASRERPQFRFLFFESTHARYSFPEAAVIRPGYLRSVDYLKLSPAYLQAHVGPLKDRYINAAHHVDAQIGRVLDAFEAGHMARDTVLIVTGDHGEAFLENGRWGHNSDFSEEQVRVPLVVSIPGRPPLVVDYPTSHLDLVPTLMPLLGIDAPPSRYSLGTPLTSSRDRLVVVSSWNDIGIITANAKVVVPFGHTTQHANLITSIDDRPLPGSSLGRLLPSIRRALARANRFADAANARATLR